MIVVPMAGKSSRFRQSGFLSPKHLLPLHDFDVLYWSLKSMKVHFDNSLFIFVNQKSNDDSERIVEVCERLKVENFEIFTIDFFTKGQAHTVYEYTSKLPESMEAEPLNIFNIDTIRPGLEFPSIPALSGWLEVFEGRGDHWSFALEDSLVADKVVQVVEKVRISEWCSTGAYSFGSAALFNLTYTSHYTSEGLQSERYVSPLLQKLIDFGHTVTMSKIPNFAMIPCGTPVEYGHCLKSDISKLFMNHPKNSPKFL